MLGDVNKLFAFKSLLTTPSNVNVLPLHLKETFQHIIWIYKEGEGDGIKSRLPFTIFFTLPCTIDNVSSPNQRHPPLWHRWFIVHILHAFKLIRSHQTSRNYVFHSRKSFVHPKKYVRRFISVNTNYLHIHTWILQNV